MNKVRFTLLLLVSAALASCSDNDDVTNPADGLAGQYEGYTTASCAYFSNQVSTDQTVTLTASPTPGKINISFESSSWGTITIDNATVSQSGSDKTFYGEGISLMGHAGGAAKEYACTADGKFADGNLQVTFTCPAIMGGLEIDFRQGAVPAEIVLPGTYTGYTKADCAYFKDMYADNQTVTIVKGSDGGYDVTLVSDNWGEFSINGAEASTEDGRFVLNGNGTCKMGMNGNVNEYACTFSGEMDAEKDDVVFSFTVPAVMGGLQISFSNGEMPQDAE